MPQTIQGDHTKHIAKGVGVTLLIFLICLVMPIFGLIYPFAIPIPILFCRMKFGRRSGGLILGISSLVMMAMLGRFSLDMIFFLAPLIIGFVLGDLMAQGLSLEKTVLWTWAAALSAGVIWLFIFSSLSQKPMGTLISDHLAESIRLTAELYKAWGVPDENLRLMLGRLEKAQDIIALFIPVFAACSALFLIWTTLLLARPVLRAGELSYPDFPLRLWKAPDFLVWGVIACGGFILLSSDRFLIILGLSGLLLFAEIYFFQGIAIVAFYFDKKHFPPMIRGMLYALIALQPLIAFLISGLGFFDFWGNFRKLETQ